MSEMNTGEVRFELDPNNLPTMTKEELAVLRAMTDDDIDYRDAPSPIGRPGRRVGGPRFGAPPIAVVLEADVLQFFHNEGDISSSRVNGALREYAEMHRKSA